MKPIRSLFFALFVISSLCAGAIYGKQAPAAADPSVASDVTTNQEQDPLKRPLSKKEKKRKGYLRSDDFNLMRKWVEEDVKYIITDEEREAFLKLSNDEERESFIEAFWNRRDPTPDTPDNEYRDEHYRRIAYANEHFASGTAGWRSDRGRIYITFGPPDEIESHPSGGTYERPYEEGGGETSTYPFEDWRYRHIDGIGDEIVVEFVDKCMCNQYKISMDVNEKDALLMVPNAGLTMAEANGTANKANRINGLNPTGSNLDYASSQSKMFDKMEVNQKMMKPPAVRYTDLEKELVSHIILTNPMPFDVQTDFVKVTSDTALVPITVQIQNKDITFVSKEGVQRGTVNILGRVTTMTGKIVQTFEDPVQITVPNELLAAQMQQASIYWKALPLRSGRYRLDVAIKDVNGERSGIWSHGIRVPMYDDDKLNTSSMILADILEKVPTTSVGAGNFVIGDEKVRPRVAALSGTPASFKHDQRLNMWMQVYNLGMDEKTKKPSATVEYDLINVQTNKSVVTATDSTEQMGNVGAQMTLEKSMALNSMAPGLYRLTVKVEDKISKQTLTRSTNFQVE